MDVLGVATNSPERFHEWHKAWKSQIEENQIKLIVMHDTEGGAIFNHFQVNSRLGKDAWIISQKSAACKSWTVYEAWKEGAERFYYLDDDCPRIEKPVGFGMSLKDWRYDAKRTGNPETYPCRGCGRKYGCRC